MKKLKKFYDQRQLHWMVLPGVAFMIVFNYIPIYGIIIAFKNYTIVDTVSSAPWVGLENFRIIMEDSFFWEAVRNTLAISLMKLFLGFAIPIILAVMIFEMRDGHLKKVIQTISYIPHFFSWIVLGGMLISWLSTNGFINQVMMSFGLMNQGVNHLLDPDKYWWIAVLSDLWKEVGWGTILYLAGMSRIDPTFYEAARIDGASKLTQIRTITLPLLAPIISLNLILNVSGLLGSNLDQTLVLMNAQNQNKSEVINSFVYRMGLTQGDFSYATAVGLGISVISIVLLVITDRITRKMNNGRSVIL
ncbi:sugar ABC transporter permease [Enterococcus faecalis]|jgi:putative aldouronate transport system permease protein|uniref:ABC transporter permease n=1 Tax=Enterococcus TaxID=1350 RepID=UPI0003310F68|nr:ABC transporter permease subunit [Enterococcus faecalis]EGO2727777.1 sugar ABC transporter permease [Enterococcus faecalis]EGO2808530.1 sugar ABC transporter permease [Enterococcus faecalis]EGO6531141.1 sugar ABC transporter permease [Enterococcus faecalis]EGO6648907.1 sugar ABC transporter permease [Enterococcus faecalis]EGO7663352.1 sugar ABC transporter permease [Enterococcus faecalis]